MTDNRVDGARIEAKRATEDNALNVTLDAVKSAAVESYVTFCSRDARRIRARDRRRQVRSVARDDRTHIDAALAWLCRAHDNGDDDGVSAMYSLVQGWMGSYPETTGYIIPTLFDAAARFRSTEYRDRAVEMADWLTRCQRADGAWPGSFVGRLSGPRVFNTGQVVFGLVRAWLETADAAYLDSAVRAGRWLLSQQDDDGAWRRCTLGGVPHAYNVRTAWALAALGEAAADGRFVDAAIAGARWTMGRQNDHGWFRCNTFNADDAFATLHTISYTMRGLLEVGVATGREDFVVSARDAASALHRSWRSDRRIGGAFAPDWTVPVSWRCLPGEGQLAIVWLRLDGIANRRAHRDVATELLEGVKSAQIMNDSHPDLYGGVSGSVPIHGGYERYCLVNWGPKFLIDALLLKASEDDAHATA